MRILLIAEGNDGYQSKPNSVRLEIEFCKIKLDIPLPKIIKPKKCVESNEYADVRYGFYTFEDVLVVNYGKNEFNSSDCCYRQYRNPFRYYEYITRRYFDKSGNELSPGQIGRDNDYNPDFPMHEATIRDLYDDSVIPVRYYEYHLEHRIGFGIFKFFRLFAKPMITRRFEIIFSHPFGSRKNSWKGGTTSSSRPITGTIHDEFRAAALKDGFEILE